MKKMSIISGLFLAGFTSAAFAQAPAYGYEPVIVDNPDMCPAGMDAEVPSYEWRDGRFVSNGWVCESLYNSGA
jgi:hypothetical protein